MKKKSTRGGRRAGAGRKPTGKPTKKAKTLSLDLDTHEGLAKLKKTTGKSQAVVVETLVKKARKRIFGITEEQAMLIKCTTMGGYA